QVALGWLQAELGADMRPDADRLERGAEVTLRLAVAVRRCRVEVVHARVDCPPHRTLTLGRRAPDDQSAHVAATKAQRRDTQSRPPQRSLLHVASWRWILPQMWGPGRPPKPPALRAPAEPRRSASVKLDPGDS